MQHLPIGLNFWTNHEFIWNCWLGEPKLRNYENYENVDSLLDLIMQWAFETTKTNVCAVKFPYAYMHFVQTFFIDVNTELMNPLNKLILKINQNFVLILLGFDWTLSNDRFFFLLFLVEYTILRGMLIFNWCVEYEIGIPIFAVPFLPCGFARISASN